MNHPTKGIPPEQTLVREYDTAKRDWGHIGVKTWRRIGNSDKKVINEMRRAKKSFTVFIYYPSVSIVKKLQPANA